LLVVVVGDTHGHYEKIQQEIQSLPHVDLLLHTGDHQRDGLALARKLKLKGHAVTGNCDRGSDGVKELALELEGHRILLTHGHLQKVKQTMNNLYYKARQDRIDIVLFGHTHVPYLEKVDGIWFMNPGSLTFPRGNRATYGLMELVPGKAELRIMEIP
jgi:putative phosphoesterase